MLYSYDSEYGVESLLIEQDEVFVDAPYYKNWFNEELLDALLKRVNEIDWAYWQLEIEKLNAPKKEFKPIWLQPKKGIFEEVFKELVR